MVQQVPEWTHSTWSNEYQNGLTTWCNEYQNGLTPHGTFAILHCALIMITWSLRLNQLGPMYGHVTMPCRTIIGVIYFLYFLYNIFKSWSFWLYMSSFSRCVNYCRIFTELAEACLEAMVSTPGEVSDSSQRLLYNNRSKPKSHPRSPLGRKPSFVKTALFKMSKLEVCRKIRDRTCFALSIRLVQSQTYQFILSCVKPLKFKVNMFSVDNVYWCHDMWLTVCYLINSVHVYAIVAGWCKYHAILGSKLIAKFVQIMLVYKVWMSLYSMTFSNLFAIFVPCMDS